MFRLRYLENCHLGIHFDLTYKMFDRKPLNYGVLNSEY